MNQKYQYSHKDWFPGNKVKYDLNVCLEMFEQKKKNDKIRNNNCKAVLKPISEKIKQAITSFFRNKMSAERLTFLQIRSLLIETQTDLIKSINSNDYSMQAKMCLLTIYRFLLKNLRDAFKEIEEFLMSCFIFY